VVSEVEAITQIFTDHKRIRLQRMRSRVNDMISATQRMAYTRRSNGQAFKAGSPDPVATPLCGVSALAAGR